MIALTEVTVRLGGRRVLDRVTLTVAPGERVALIGPNGAGKTTLLRAAVGLVPFEGRVTIDGRDLRQVPAAARALVGYVPQVPGLPAHASAADVVALFQELRGVPPDPLTVLQEVGLEGAAARPIGTLSGGMVRRLALAMARLGDPPCLLLDEPTSHLDREGEELVRRWLADARTEGRTVVLATHHLDGLEPLVDRVALLEEGRVVAQTDVGALRYRRALDLLVTPPLPADLPAGVLPLPSANGALRLRVPRDVLGETVRLLGDRVVSVREVPVEMLLREADR
jgi:ABC-type multidrug transport system ATPase subunit